VVLDVAGVERPFAFHMEEEGRGHGPDSLD
jgi:hypothetical protein